MQGRDMVLPEDIQAVAVPVMAHRLEAGHGPGPTRRTGTGAASVRDGPDQLDSSVP